MTMSVEAAQPAHGDDRPPSYPILCVEATCHLVGSHGPPWWWDAVDAAARPQDPSFFEIW